jgi:hypothetical protein
MSYDNMLNQLNNMAGSMYLRTSLGEMMTNVWENGKYSLAGSMASNPVAYLTYKVASLLDSTVGGIGIPFLSAFGNGIDLETTVADLMRVAALSTGVIGSLGEMISGLGSSFDGRAMLTKMGIESSSKLAITPRGSGEGISTSDAGGGKTLSSSGYTGNASPSDIKDTTIQESEDTKDQLMVEAMEEDESQQHIKVINENVIKIYEVLEDVASGKRSFNVKVADYGLTSAGGNTAAGGAQGGVDGINNSTANNNDVLGGGFGTNETGSASEGTVDLGGWTMQ